MTPKTKEKLWLVILAPTTYLGWALGICFLPFYVAHYLAKGLSKGFEKTASGSIEDMINKN